MSLTITLDMENAKCDYCGKKATQVYFAKTLLGTKWRKFCNECDKVYKRVKDDLNGNRI